jgi:hypothetical protein
MGTDVVRLIRAVGWGICAFILLFFTFIASSGELL